MLDRQQQAWPSLHGRPLGGTRAARYPRLPLGLVLKIIAPMFPHTTEDLSARANCTADTILEWKRLGYFEGIESSLTGRGKSSGVKRLWAEGALDRVQEIVDLKKRGYNTEMLQAHFQKKAPR